MVEIELKNNFFIKYKHGQWILSKKSIYLDKKTKKEINKYKTMSSNKNLSEIFKSYFEIEFENSDISKIEEIDKRIEEISDTIFKMLGKVEIG